jgi:hypothetical protein
MADLSNELAAFLRESVGIIPQENEYRIPTQEQALAKNFFNTMNLTQKENGSWTPNF